MVLSRRRAVASDGGGGTTAHAKENGRGHSTEDGSTDGKKLALSSSSSSPRAALSPASRVLLLIFFAYAVVFSAALTSLFAFKPSPLPASAPPTLFSEERALRDVFALAGEEVKPVKEEKTSPSSPSPPRPRRLGERQLATPGCARAAAHLERRVEELALAARAAGLEAEWESRAVSGGVDSSFLHFPFSNVFLGVRNVVLKISPRGSSTPAVLVGSHYDSALGSPGAADAAVPISIALEVARVAVAAAEAEAEAAAKGNKTTTGSSSSSSRAPLRAPLLLVLNGGEESLMLGSAAFMLEKEGEIEMEELELSASDGGRRRAGDEKESFRRRRRRRPHFREGVGAVLNLESTGADSPHFMFQHAGAFPLAAWAKGSRRPRGTVIAQDFFDAGLSPAATDFECFCSPSAAVVAREAARVAAGSSSSSPSSSSSSSSPTSPPRVGEGGRREQGDLPCAAVGKLPGLDVALMLGAEVYHTFMDNPQRLKPGTVQAMGADAVGVVWELADRLAAATEKLLLEKTEGDSDGDASAAAAAAAAASPHPPPPSAEEVVASLGDPAERSVYFDVLGLFFVSYSRDVGLWLHSLPLALSLLLAAAAAASSPPPLRRSDTKSGGGFSSSLCAVAAATLAAALSAAGAVALPALLGAALAMLTRRPMGWFGAGGAAGGSFLGVAAFAPAAVAGALWPYSLLSSPPPQQQRPSQRRGRSTLGCCAPTALLGAAVTTGAAAAALARARYGASYAFALWSFSCCAAALALLLPPPPPASSSSDASASASASEALAVLLLALPALVTSPDALVLALHILQKASFAGSPLPPPLSFALSDAAAGAVVGACSLSVMGGVPALAAAAMMATGGERKKEKKRENKRDGDGKSSPSPSSSPSSSLVRRASFALALASAAVLLFCSFLRTPHTPLAPKKIFLQLVHRLETTATTEGSNLSTRSKDVTRIASSRWLGGGVDAVPSAPFLPDPLGPWRASPGDGHSPAWLSLFPLGKILETSRGGGGERRPRDDSAVGGPPLPLPPPPPPALKLLSRAPVVVPPVSSSSSSVSSSSLSPSRERVELALDISDPTVISRGAFGALNVTGRVLRWSLTDSFSSPPPGEVSPSSSSSSAPSSSSSSSSLAPWRIVRFGGVPPHVAEAATAAAKKKKSEDEETGGKKKKEKENALPYYWRFWLEVPKGEKISVSAAVSAVGIGTTPGEVEALDGLFAPEVSSTLVETWVGEWEF